MKTFSIRELRNRTGELVRLASREGEIRITDHGRVIAKITPEYSTVLAPYFSRRRLTAAFKRLDSSGKTGRGTDSTATISAGRDEE